MAIFRPTLQRNRVTDLSVKTVQQLKISTLLLDVDNTLSTHHSQIPLNGVEKWLADMTEAGVSLFIVSNAKKERVAPFAEQLGLPYFWLCKKPLPFRLKKAIRQLGAEKRSVMLCGDQLFTDMAAGNLCGIRTLLVTPAQLETGWTFRLRRCLERPLLKRYKKEQSQ
ncbi:MAG: YqeG family HAD IIIA-type phosphatase [Clostridia bacterium]|nr:YqeG family HAD IIIA-type phosphatase [Clostridia bacterium]